MCLGVDGVECVVVGLPIRCEVKGVNCLLLRWLRVGVEEMEPGWSLRSRLIGVDG